MSERERPLVLYVDDDPDYREVMRHLIESGGYRFAEAASAEQGLRAYQQQRPDLVIVDLMMEEVDSGTAFVKELRLLGNQAPVYMLTVGESMSLSADHMALGLAGIFQKPVERSSLLGILKARLGG